MLGMLSSNGSGISIALGRHEGSIYSGLMYSIPPM